MVTYRVGAHAPAKPTHEHRPGGRHSPQRRVRRFFAFGGASAADQKVATWRFASAAARPRAEPTTAFAPLSHMLKKGFFFVHGFFMIFLADHECLISIAADLTSVSLLQSFVH
jgi:hypothetical protein